MSVILDALRKSEHERQRSTVPGLAHVPLATPRNELPRWALVVIGVLGAAVLVLGGAWLQGLRGTPPQPATDATSRALESPAPSAGAPTAAPRAARAEPAPSPAPAPAPTPRDTAPLPSTAAPNASPVAPASQSLAEAAAATARNAAAAEAPAPAPSLETAATSPISAPATAAQVGATETRSEPTLPSAAALMAQGVSLPPLKLELHAYAPEPAARFVFINGRKYVEGQRLAEGPEVAAIAPNGAVLSYLGQRFLLAPE
jgi:general secretion pathway protein B